MSSGLFANASSFLCNLARTGVALAIAAVSLSWAVGVIDVDRLAMKPWEGAGPVVETTRVKMAVPRGQSCSEYALEDEEGRVLLRVMYLQEGGINVNLGDAFPINPGFSAGLDGRYDFSLAHEGMEHRLRIRPGAPSRFSIASRSSRIGEYLFDPWAVEH